MSFSVSLDNRRLEWGSNGLPALFATRGNTASPAFYSMISDMMRFNKYVPPLVALSIMNHRAHPVPSSVRTAPRRARSGGAPRVASTTVRLSLQGGAGFPDAM